VPVPLPTRCIFLLRVDREHVRPRHVRACSGTGKTVVHDNLYFTPTGKVRSDMLTPSERAHAHACACADARTRMHIQGHAHTRARIAPSAMQVNECNMELSAWQQRGEDKNSTVASMPDDATLIGWAKAKLGF
jgi:hypothetical protein